MVIVPASLAGRDDHPIGFPGTSSLANFRCPFGTLARVFLF
jgi:hypothetical protein